MIANVNAGGSEKGRAAFILVLCGVFLVIYTAPSPPRRRSPEWSFGTIPTSGLGRPVKNHHETYDYLAALPPHVLIAGWPTDLDDVPYLALRPVLVSRELHQAFHKAYADLMRKRTEAVIDATFSPDPSALLRLRDEFGVTHFLVNRRRYREPETFAYFKPFDEKIEEARRRLGDRRPAVLREADRGAVFNDGEDWVVVDLLRLPAPPDGRGGTPVTSWR